MSTNYVVTKRRGSQRTVTPTSSIEVISIIRTEPFTWLAITEYRHGQDMWHESILFRVTHDYDTEPATRVVHVSDADNSGDRDIALHIEVTDERAMPHIILDFMASGRW